MFGWGFLMWIMLIFIGTFIRGPGWIWFWPGQTWDHNTVVFDRNRDVHEVLGLTVANFPNYAGLMKWLVIPAFGFLLVAGFYVLGGMFFHWLMLRGAFKLRYFKSWADLKRWADDARAVLEPLPDVSAKAALAAVCDAVIARTF